MPTKLALLPQLSSIFKGFLLTLKATLVHWQQQELLHTQAVLVWRELKHFSLALSACRWKKLLGKACRACSSLQKESARESYGSKSHQEPAKRLYSFRASGESKRPP